MWGKKEVYLEYFEKIMKLKAHWSANDRDLDNTNDSMHKHNWKMYEIAELIKGIQRHNDGK